MPSLSLNSIQLTSFPWILSLKIHFSYLQHKVVETILLTGLLILTNKVILTNGQGSLGRSQDYNGANAGALGTMGSKNGNTLANRETAGGSGAAPGGEIITKSSSLNMNEPSCDELRAMWRFSKRQSRASEITNEIPTYHDPFTYNVWDPYYPATTRSLGGRRINTNSRYREGGARPVYGRILHKQPSQQQQQLPMGGRYYGVPPTNLDRNRVSYDDITRLYGAENRVLENQQQPVQPPRRLPKFRSGSVGSAANTGGTPSAQANLGAAAYFGSTGINANMLTPQRGSFQRLKELVWNERAKELQQQRKNEEIAVRAAILKDLTNGQHYKASHGSRRNHQTSAQARSGGGGIGGANVHKNKSLRDGKNSNHNANKDDMQLLSYPSYLYQTNDNMKRSALPASGTSSLAGGDDVIQNNYGNINDDDFMVMPNGNSLNIGGSSSEIDDVTYDDDEDTNYGPSSNGFFNNVNEDNINDFYLYINELLSNTNTNNNLKPAALAPRNTQSM